MIARVDVTPEARKVIELLKSRFGPLMFHQSGGCCDGSQPMCFESGELRLGVNDVCLGEIVDTEFWMCKDQYEYWKNCELTIDPLPATTSIVNSQFFQYEYWKNCELTIDVVAGRGSSFSLEIPLGVRFIVKSRLFTEDELRDLAPLKFVDD